MNYTNGLNDDISNHRKNVKSTNNLTRNNLVNIQDELARNNLQIRIVESPHRNVSQNIKFMNQTSSSTFNNKNKNDEEGKYDIGEIRKTDVSSEEFFMRRSQMNYIRKNLSPVKAITLNKNSNPLNNSIKRIFSAKVNNYANIIKSDLILVCNLIQKNSNIINYFKHQFENEMEVTKKNSNKLKNSDINFFNKTSSDTLSNFMCNYNRNDSNQNNTSINSTNSGKINIQNILIQKRCFEIENETKENFAEIIEKLNENSKNMDLLMNQYKCLIKDELIYKMSLENNLNQLLIKKIDDLFFLANLKNINENNEFMNLYSETHSKIQNIKNFVEYFEKSAQKSKEKSVTFQQNNSNLSGVDKENKNRLAKNVITKKLSNKNLQNICKYDCTYCNEKDLSSSMNTDITKNNNIISIDKNEKNVFYASNSIRSIPEVNELNETLNTSKLPFSKKNSKINSKNGSIIVKRKTSGIEEKSSGIIKFDLIKIGSVSENNNEDENFLNDSGENLNYDNFDSNKILEMNTFAEFKNYETENQILNHIKKLHDNLNEKIFQIFFNYFSYFYNYEEKENHEMSNNTQRSKTKLRGIMLKKNDDGIMSYLFIREEFEKIIKEKDDYNKSIIKNNEKLNENIKELEKKLIDMTSENNAIKIKIYKKEIEIKLEYIQNIDKENTNYLNKFMSKFENKIKETDSENIRLKFEIDVLENKIKGLNRDMDDLKVKLEYFTKSEERRYKKKKLNDSYEDVLNEQFDNMKNAFISELETLRKENTKINNDHKKIINKYDIEISDLKQRNLMYYRQMEDIKIICNNILNQ